MKSEKKKRGYGRLAFCMMMFAFTILMVPAKTYAKESPWRSRFRQKRIWCCISAELLNDGLWGLYYIYGRHILCKLHQNRTGRCIKKGDTIVLHGISYRVYDLEPGSIYLSNPDGEKYRIDKTNDSLNRGEGITIAPYRVRLL